MSFGFPEEILVDGQRAISNAILESVRNRNCRIIYFAASASRGGNQEVMFPATHPFVIPVRATDHLGIFQDFNPPPDYHGPDVFRTLGKDVPSAGLHEHEGERCETGTSVSTPIMAGIAAMVLDCARMYLSEDQQQTPELDKLWMQNGMLSMFRQMSRRMSEKCLYLNPLEFLRTGDEQRWTTMKAAAFNTRV